MTWFGEQSHLMFTTAFGAVDKQLNPSHVLKEFCPTWNVTEVQNMAYHISGHYLFNRNYAAEGLAVCCAGAFRC